MIKLPSQEKKLLQPNSTDLLGNLYYTKSVNLDELGYVKLSSRCVSLINEEVDSNFDLPMSFGRNSTANFYVVTADKPYEVSLSSSVITVTQDTDADLDGPPQGTIDSNGVWWENKWHHTTADDLFYKIPANGNWKDTGIGALSSGSTHAVEVFKSRNNLCVSDGRYVKQFSSGYSTTDPLTSALYAVLAISTDYEITAISFSNGRLGVVANPSDTVAGQNIEAFFYTWDGQLSTPNQAYPIGCDVIVGIVPYKSSWVLLTRSGELKYFNGGGFQTLAYLPFWYLNKIWGTVSARNGYGDLMAVEGDIIYFNVKSILANGGVYGEEYQANNQGGILCYDPAVGIYHRYAPSISAANMISVTDANVNITTNTFTKTAGTIPATGNPIKYTSSASVLVGGLTINTIYYVIKVDASNFKLATTKANAIAGTAIDITSVGNTINYFVALDVVDYGISKTARTGGMAFQSTQSSVYDHLIFGGEYMDSNSITDYAHLNITIPGFKNIGYFVTVKDSSNQITDTLQRVYCKYRPLKSDDTITVKYKTEDVINLPVSTPQENSAACTWASSTSFTTTANLSAAKTYLDASDDHDCEVEVISGAGAGQVSQISTITELNGTYTVTIADALDGAVLNNVCDVVIENWKTLGTITSADDLGFKEFTVGAKSTWFKYKVIMSGSDIVIEEFRSENKDFKKA
jgi:hypothetical protein